MPRTTALLPISSPPSPAHRPGRRSVLAAGAASLLVPAVAGCGPNAGGGGRPDGLLVSWYGGQPVHKGVEGALDAFTSTHSDISLTTEKAEFADYWDKLATQTAGGQGPDVLRMSMSYFAEYAERGALLDLGDLIGKGADGGIDLSALDADVATSGRTDAGTFGVGQSSITHATFRNPELVKKVGVELPEEWSWEDFTTFCEDFASAGGKGMYGSTDVGGNLQVFEVWARQHGDGLFGDDGVLVTADVLEDWFALWQGLRKKKAVPPADVTAEGTGFETNQLALGTAAVTFGWVQQVTFFQPLIPDSPLEVSSLPGLEAGDLSGQFVKALDLWCVSAKTAQADQAAQLIDFLINDEAAVTSIGLTLGVPPSKTSRDLLGAEPDSAEGRAIAYVDAVTGKTGEAPPAWPAGYSQLLEAFPRADQSVAFGDASPASAAADFLQQAKSAVSGG